MPMGAKPEGPSTVESGSLLQVLGEIETKGAFTDESPFDAQKLALKGFCFQTHQF
jgi:hypothetical protein